MKSSPASATVQGPMQRPVIFSGEMVRAILDGRKTQTRRIAKFFDNDGPMQFNPRYEDGWWEAAEKGYQCRCPYGVAGDRLWVRETHWRHGYWSHPSDDRRKFVPTAAQPVYYLDRPGYENYESPKDRTERAWYKRPSIFMPRWASRITLEITKVRVERLQDISEEDAIAEGVVVPERNPFDTRSRPWAEAHPYKYNYSLLWDSLYGKGAWDKNPWVWCITFKRHLSENTTKSDSAMGASIPNSCSSTLVEEEGKGL